MTACSAPAVVRRACQGPSGKRQSAFRADDYPAAHSTDATWFAVDKDGHVAEFETSGWGEVPPSAAFVGEVYENSLAYLPEDKQTVLFNGLYRRHRESKAILDLQGLILPAFDEPLHIFLERQIAPLFFGEGKTNLLFLKDADAARQDIVANRAYAVSATRGVAIVYRDGCTPSPELAWQWHEEGTCLGCFDHSFGEAITDCGLVRYSDLAHGVDVEPTVYADWFRNGENALPANYGRIILPERPLLCDELPLTTQELVNWYRFGSICFLETPHVLSFSGDMSLEARCSFHQFWLEETLRAAEEAEMRGDLRIMNYLLDDAQRHERMRRKFSDARSEEGL